MKSATVSADGILSNHGTSKLVWTQVTEDDIEKYHTAYRGSEEERSDLLQLYERFHGNMDQVAFLCSSCPCGAFLLHHPGFCGVAELVC